MRNTVFLLLTVNDAGSVQMAVGNLDNKFEAFTVTKGGKFLDY